MSKHSMNTNSVFQNATPVVGNAGFQADCAHVLDFSLREPGQGISRVRRKGFGEGGGYSVPGLERRPRMGSHLNFSGGLSPVLWARLVLSGSSAS